MAYGDGEAPANVVAHVHACSTCTKQVSGYTQMQGELRRSLYRFDCPDAHRLGEYQLDLLEPDDRRRVAAHAVDCDACSDELLTLRSYLAMPTVIGESLLQHARRVVATLFRPAPGRAYGGLGGTSKATARVFQIEDVTITVGPGQAPGTLVGLVLVDGTESHTLDGRAVRLVPAERGGLTSTIDDLGNFEFEGVPDGMYALEIQLSDALVVVVEELRLG